MSGGQNDYQTMKKIGLNRVLVLSIVGNIVLVMLVAYIGCIKTDFAKRGLQKIGIIEKDLKDLPDYTCIQGWTNTLEKLNLDVEVAFFGNSITRQSDFRKYFPEKSICNLGYGGDTPERMILRVDQIKAVHPEKVFVMAGINGLTRRNSQEFNETFVTLVDSIKAAVPNAKIYLQSLLPVNPELKNGKQFKNKIERITQYNAIMNDVAKNKGCTYIDLYSLYAVDDTLPQSLTQDGLHLLPEAYDKWASAIKKYIEE